MGRIRSVIIFLLLASAALFLLSGCENALLTYVFDTLFGPPYRLQVAKLLPPGTNNINFGYSVDISGDYLIVGAPTADSGHGAAYIYYRTGIDSWDDGTKIIASDAASGDVFGGSVAINGDFAVVGAPEKDVPPETRAGAIYIYKRTGANSWDNGTRITLNDITQGSETSDLFGTSVAIDGNWLAAGATQDDLGGAPGDNYGAVYIFKYDGVSWEYEEREAPGTTQDALFGSAVDLSGTSLIVGAKEEDVPTDSEGAVYMYSYNVDGWFLDDRVIATDPEIAAWFGNSVATTGEYAVAGAPQKTANGFQYAGAAYTFQRSSGNEWDLISPLKLTADSPDASDFYGQSVAVFGDYLIVGAAYDDDFASEGGAAYLYNRTGGNSWELLSTLSPSDVGVGMYFGVSAAMSQKYALIGASDPYTQYASGAAYVFR